MAFWNRKRKKEETRENIIDENSVDAALLSALVGGDAVITFEQALQIPAVAASIDFISSICARVPVKLYRENGEDTEEIADDSRVTLLNDETGDLLNAYQMKKAWVTDYFDGQGYIYIDRDRRGIKSLRYVEKQYISVNKYTNPVYKDADVYVSGLEGSFHPFEFLRLCRNTKDGVTGVSITDSNSQLLALYYATLKFERKQMKTGGGKKGFLTSETRLSKEVIEDMRSAWRRVFTDDQENMMVLNKGTGFQEASATPTELQLNENKRTNANDITLLFLLSPKALQGASDDEIVSAIKTACIPIIEQMEAAFNAGLLLESEKRSMYFSCDTSTLERGDILKRYQAYEIAIKSHFMQADEIRYKEDMKPLGLDWIELGLDSVLYNPETKEIYTPNTNETASMNRSAELRYNDDQPRDDHGRWTSDGGNSSGGERIGSIGGADTPSSEPTRNPQAKKTHQELIDEAEAKGIDRVTVEKLDHPLSESEIIEKLQGGDMTRGSCASLALAYTANKAQMDVTDYRGGESCEMFATNDNLLSIAAFDGVKSTTVKDTNDIKASVELLKTAEPGREYILVTGKHAAIVRRKPTKGFEYLDLQNPDAGENGFKPLTSDALKTRFGCKKSHSVAGYKLEATSALIDCESLGESKEFGDLMQYVNTHPSEQQKGVSGRAK